MRQGYLPSPSAQHYSEGGRRGNKIIKISKRYKDWKTGNKKNISKRYKGLENRK